MGLLEASEPFVVHKAVSPLRFATAVQSLGVGNSRVLGNGEGFELFEDIEKFQRLRICHIQAA